MHFDTSHTFASIDVAKFERLYFDEALNVPLCEAVGLQRRLIHLDHAGGTIKRVVEITPIRDIPAAVRKVLGSKTITYTETTEYFTATHRGTWSTESSIMSDKISSSGELMITAHPQGVVRRVLGDITVRVFGLGGLIERFIVADVESSYKEAARFTERHIQSIGS